MMSTSSSSQPNDNETLLLNHITPVRTIMTLSESQNQVYLSLIWQGGQLGVAYYNLDTTEINMMMDTIESDRFTTLQSIIHQINPTYVLISSKQDERLTKCLRSIVQKHIDIPNDGEDTSNNDFIRVLPGVDFSFEVCKRRLLSTELPSMPKHFLENERTLYLSSLIPFENVCMVRAAGSLLKYLEKNRIGIELEADHVKVPILNIKIFSLKGQIIIDNTTLSALQIFQKESHPSAYKSGLSSSKEGLSLFGILNRCKSQIGSKLLRTWFLRPLRDLTILQQRQNAIAYLMNGRHMETVQNLEGCLRQIRNVSRILSRMMQSQASIADWQALYKTVYHSIYIGDICRAQNQEIDIFRKISKTFTEDLHRIASLISKIVDFDESVIQNRFVVKHNVDAELDEKKRTYNGLPNFMTEVAKEELKNLHEDITECNVIYLPQLGYLVAIPKSDNMKTEEDFKIPGLEFIFLSNNMVHYKSAYTRNLDKILGDTQCEITDHETTIMHRLQDTVLEHSAVLSHVMEHAAELDCLMALALPAREFSYVQPILNQDNIIEIKNGRHPLQEIVCSPFVPNDTFSGGSNSKIKILTSPNASGKSVYLKQVALIVYMACIGSFIPAESPSKICTVDRIFTRIKSQESVSIGLSTFMLDINQMSDALRNATSQSLVIVDEFGKGTETVDGLALFAASLRHWIEMEEKCPHILVSTHFHSIIQYNLLPKSNIITYQTMETMHNGEELVFLFQLVPGFTKSSYANETALQAGLPSEIVKRGVEISKLIQENQPIHRVDTASTEQQLKRYHYLVNQFLEVNLETADLHTFLNDVVMSSSKRWQ